jgi:Ca2+-binding RTX toxin-like protein
MSDNQAGGISGRFFYSEFTIGENTGDEMSIMPIRPPFGGADRAEMSELFEQKTGWMDRFVDAIGFDDTKVYEANGKTVIDAGMGSDQVTVTSNDDGGVTVSVNGRTYNFTEEQAKNLEIRGGSGDDNIKIDRDVEDGITVRGESGNDTIQGGGGADRIFGGSGTDTIKGGHGNDYIHGGSGNDTIHGERGNDRIFGGSGNDEVRGGRGNDTIQGGQGADKLHGERGKDSITRDWQDSEVKGGKGDDRISWDNGTPFRPIDLLRNWRA